MKKSFKVLSIISFAIFGSMHAMEAGSKKSVQSAYSQTNILSSIMREAVIHGDHDVVKILLQNGQNPNEMLDNQGHTALHLACQKGYLAAVTHLLSHGANPDQRTIDGKSARYFAAQCENPQFLENYDMLFDPTRSGNSAIELDLLHNAILIRSMQLVKTLVDRGADVNILFSNGQSALHVAVETGDLRMVQYLVKSGADISIPSAQGKTAQQIAIDFGYSEIVDYLKEISIPKERASAIEVPEEYNEISTAKVHERRERSRQARAHRANRRNQNTATGNNKKNSSSKRGPNQTLDAKQTGHETQVEQGKFHQVVQLIPKKRRAELAAFEQFQNDKMLLINRLEKAVRNWSTQEGIKEIRDIFATEQFRVMPEIINMQINGATLLWMAVSCSRNNGNCLDIIKELVEHGADVNIASHNGITPLLIAVADRNVPAVHYLLEQGANFLAHVPRLFNGELLDSDTETVYSFAQKRAQWSINIFDEHNRENAIEIACLIEEAVNAKKRKK